MSYVQKPNFGSLFKNDKKADNQPDYRGSVTLPDGKVMELAAWEKSSNSGESFLSLKLSEPRERAAKPTEDRVPF